MSVFITCSVCKKVKEMMERHYYYNLSKFKVCSVAELSKQYKCRKCRQLKKLQYLHNSAEFKKLENILQEEVRLTTIRIKENPKETPTILSNFKQNLTKILNDHGIKNYSFIIDDKKNQLIAITFITQLYGDRITINIK